MMPKKMKTTKARINYEVAPIGFGLFGWKLTRKHPDGKREEIYRFNTQEESIETGVDVCQAMLKFEGQWSELFIKNRWGRIRDKRTYGGDPKRIKG